MSHNHSLCSHNGNISDSLGRVLMVSIIINLLYVAIETFVGLSENSLGLLSDAGHNLGDVFSLILTYMAFRLAKIPETGRFTYGYKKSTILVALLNAVLLVVAVILIIVESISKISAPVSVNGTAVSWTAFVGIVVNGLTVWFLMKYRKKDINVRGAFMHMLADTLVSLGVLVSGILINITGWMLIDVVVSLSVSAVIMHSSLKLLYEGIVLVMDGVPLSVDIQKVKQLISSTGGVEEISSLHVWALSTTENAMTAKIVLKDKSDINMVKARIREQMQHEGISHCTIETETI